MAPLVTPFSASFFKFSQTTSKETKIQCDELIKPWPQEYHTSLCFHPHCVGGWGGEWVMTWVSPSAHAWPGKHGVTNCVASTSPGLGREDGPPLHLPCSEQHTLGPRHVPGAIRTACPGLSLAVAHKQMTEVVLRAGPAFWGNLRPTNPGPGLSRVCGLGPSVSSFFLWSIITHFSGLRVRVPSQRCPSQPER